MKIGLQVTHFDLEEGKDQLGYKLKSLTTFPIEIIIFFTFGLILSYVTIPRGLASFYKIFTSRS